MKTAFKIFLILALWGTFGMRAEAATLDIVPSAGSYKVGETVLATIRVSSTEVAANALEGSVSFPPAILELVSIEKNDSIIDFWIREPQVSNKEGTAHFEGVIFNPGFIGEKGSVLTLKFRVKKPGEARVSFSSATVLANDGLGSEMLTETFGSHFIFLHGRAFQN